MTRNAFKALGLSLLLLFGAACGEDEEAPTLAGLKARTPAAAAPKPTASAPPPSPTLNMPPLPLREFQEADFTESDRSRDPFRTFEQLFVKQAKSRATLQRQVLVERYALDELKLVGVVTRGSPSALLIDPSGLGWVVKTGDFVGKAEIVRSGGPAGADVAVNWRVDRIREGDIVFVREDPSRPEIPPTTRVISLRPTEGGGAGSAASSPR